MTVTSLAPHAPTRLPGLRRLATSGRRSDLHPSYHRIVLRQRRASLRLAAIVAVSLPAASLAIHVATGTSEAAIALAALSMVAMSGVAVAGRGLRADRLWMAMTALGLAGIVTPVAATVIEPATFATYADGMVGMVPIGMAVFATWSLASQLRWSVVALLVLISTILVAPGSEPLRAFTPTLLGGFILGSGFGLAAALFFERARLQLYRAGRVNHAHRGELVAANRLARRTLAQMRAVESIGATLTEQGATPAALDLVTGILSESFGYSHPSIYVGDETQVRLGAQRGYDTPVELIRAGQWVIGRALDTGTVQLVTDTDDDPDYRAACAEVTSQIAIPLRADGHIIGVLNVESRGSLDQSDVASITVVADRVAAALDLAERHHTLEAIVDGAPVAIVAYDRNDAVRFWGAGAERMFGWSAADVLGRTTPFRTSIDAATDPAYHLIVSGERVDGVEADRPDRNGVRVPVRIFAAPFKDGPGGGQIVVYQDLTTERRTATALEESELRYESLVASLHEGVVLQDANGVIVASNPAAQQILGLTADELAGGTSRDPRWRAIREDGSDLPADQHPAPVALRSGEAVLGVVMGVRKPSGDLVWVSVDAVPLQPGASPAGGVVLSFSDITDRQRLQADLLHAQKMDSVGRLAGGIAHDFNNLLTAILGNGQMLVELVEGEAAEHVDEVLRAAERAAELTRQLLGFARKTMLDAGDHELNAIVTDMEPMIRRLVGAHIAVVTRLDPAVGHVRVDRSQMDQVLLNLAVNARDAMSDGGVLSIETATIRRGELDPSLTIDADRVAILRVRDSGVGMDDEIRRHAFDPFYTTKPRGHGTGLGLATTHGIIVQSGGAITVDSIPGDGATFTIFLPEVEAVAAPQQPASAASPTAGVGTILLVEDEDAVREVGRRILERAGYRVLHAPNANAAMSVIGGDLEAIDLVVSDVVMPGQRGPEMYEAMRARRPDLPAVFLSGYADLADATDALPSGTRFLAKPYLPDDLVRIVQLSLAERAS